jgi:hypothetical protein
MRHSAALDMLLNRKVLAGIPPLVRYRQEAEQCHQLAERARTQIDKEAWLRLATDWITLAEGAEKERPPRSEEK